MNLNFDNILKQAQSGDDNSIELIINMYSNMVYKNSSPFFLKGGDRDDLIQEGYIGLLNAIKFFDKTKFASFSTFASLCITRQIISTVKRYNFGKYKILNDAFFGDLYSENEEKISYNTPSLKFYSPEEIILAKELIKLLNNYLEINLSHFEKKVCYFLINQYTYIEIADLLSETPKKIDNTIQRIKKKVNLYLSNYTK